MYPDLVSAISSESFNLFGIKPIAYTLNGQLIPVILMCLILSYVEKWLNKVLPNSLKFVFSGFLSLLIMIPLTIYILTPFGVILGSVIAMPISLLGKLSPALVTCIAGGLWVLFISMGMHAALAALFIMDFYVTGVNYSLLPVVFSLGYIGAANDLAIYLKSKDPEIKKLASSGIASQILGGIVEPSLYGIYLKNPNTLLSICLGMAACGLVMGVLHVGVFAFTSGNFLGVTAFMAGGMDNFLRAIPGILVGMAVAFTTVMVLGVEKKKI